MRLANLRHVDAPPPKRSARHSVNRQKRLEFFCVRGGQACTYSCQPVFKSLRMDVNCRRSDWLRPSVFETTLVCMMLFNWI